MKLRFLHLLLVLLFIVYPVSAVEHLTANDFKEVPVTIDPSKNYYREGERIEIEYTIEPVDEDAAKKLDERYYTFGTDLEKAEITAVVTLMTGASVYHPKKGDVVEQNKLEISIGDTVEGVYSIQVSVSGIVPSIVGERYKEIRALYINITDSDEDALSPVIIKIYNLDEFNKDVAKLEDRLINFKSSISSLSEEGYDVTEIENAVKDIEVNLSIAKEYLSKGDYADCDEKLSFIESEISKLNNSIDKMRADKVYASLKETLGDISSMLEDIDLYLAQVAGKAGIEKYTALKENYRDLKKKYNDLEGKINNIKSNYIDQGKYATAYSKLNEYKDDVNNLNSETQSLLEDVKAVLFGKPEEGGGFGFDIVGLLKEYALYITAGVAGVVLVVVAILAFKRRGGRWGRWDELR